MKKAYYLLSILFCIGLLAACQKDKDTQEVSELKEEIQELKGILESESSITEVSFDGSDMVLTFANGSQVTVTAPSNIIPQIGGNGNWWVNGEDLGVPAEAEMPSIGENGNWWIGDTDTGVKAEGVQGVDGEDGTGIESVSYDPETAILTILLTDETSYEYVLFYEDSIQGIKLGDLNGRYLLETIYNGDLPFATFSYNSNNQLTDINYFKSVLNQPTLMGGLHRVYNAENKIQSQTLTEYSTVQKAVPVGSVLPNAETGIEMTYEEAFNEIYPNGLQGYSGTAVDFFETVYQLSHSGYIYTRSYKYEYNPDGSGSYIEKNFISKNLIRTDGNKQFGMTDEDGQLFAWTGYYDSWSNSWAYFDWAYCYASNDITVDQYGNLSYNYYSQQEYQYYSYCTLASENTSSTVNETTGNRLSDFIALESGNYENPDNLTGNYKFLLREYDLYEQGDEIQHLTFNYAYNNNDYAVSKDGEDIYNITVANDKIESVSYYDGVETVQLLQMNYENEKLISITSPHYQAIDVVTVEYDSEGNPVNYLVNSKDLAGQGDDEALAELGLAYKSEVYDNDLGMVVEKYIYPSEPTSLLKLNYDYTMKNFMNHTITAINPLLSVFNSQNAIQEFVWAGHGSCFIAEYNSFNDGGYPTQFKGLLQIAPSDFDNDVELPINGSVATTYRLSYKKIEE